jgi:hypothetical protein
MTTATSPQRGAQNFDAAARKRKGHEFTNRQAGQLGRKNLITAAACSTFTTISHPNKKKHEQKLSQTKWSTVPMIQSKHNKNSINKARGHEQVVHAQNLKEKTSLRSPRDEAPIYTHTKLNTRQQHTLDTKHTATQ